MIDSGFHPRDCGCYSHNGFLTKRGYEMERANRRLESLTGEIVPIRVDIPVSVSAPEGEGEPVSKTISERHPGVFPDAPPGSGEVR